MDANRGKRRTHIEAWDLLSARCLGQELSSGMAAAVKCAPLTSQWLAVSAGVDEIQLWQISAARQGSRRRRVLGAAGIWEMRALRTSFQRHIELITGGQDLLIATGCGAEVTFHRLSGTEISRIELEAPVTALTYAPPGWLAIATEFGLITLQINPGRLGQRGGSGEPGWPGQDR